MHSDCKTAWAFMKAFNGRDHARMHALLSEDIVYVDSTGGRIAGRDQVLRLISWLVEADPAFRQEPADCSQHGEKVLMRGEVVATRAGTSGRVLWELVVDKGAIRHFQSFRAEGALPLVKLYNGAFEQSQFKLQRSG